MGRAISTASNGEVEEGSELTMFMVPVAFLKTLSIQADHEGCSPGEVLDKAIRAYLEEHGCDDAVSYLWSIAEDGKG